MSDPTARAARGDIVNERYLLRELLGESATGPVWHADRLQAGRPVAIKLLDSSLSGKRDFRQRFEREAVKASRLYHVNCVPPVDYGFHGDVPYLVADFIPGPTITEVLRERAIPPRRAVATLQQLLDGLGYLHGHTVVHRGVRADNVKLVSSRHGPEVVKLLDAGTATVLTAAGVEAFVGRRETLVGAPGAMAPEQIDEGEVDARTDIYAAGILLFEMLAQRQPFADENRDEVLRMHLHTRPPSARDTLDAAISTELDAVVARALAKAPDQRFQTAEDMADALASTPEGQALDAGTVVQVPQAAPILQPIRAGNDRGLLSRPRVGWTVASVLGAALLVAVAAPALKGSGDESEDNRVAAAKASPPAVPAPPAPMRAAPAIADPREPALRGQSAPNDNATDAPTDDPTDEPADDSDNDPIDEPADDSDNEKPPVGEAAADGAGAEVTALPWRKHREQARTHLRERDYRAAWQQIRGAVRASPKARLDPALIDMMVSVLSLPTADQFIPGIVEDFGDVPAAVEAIVDAVPNGSNWYVRHHALVVLMKMRLVDRADRVGMWMTDLRQSRRCASARRAFNKLTRAEDERAASLVADIRRGKGDLTDEQRQCLASLAGSPAQGIE